MTVDLATTSWQQLGDMGEVPTVDLASTSWQQLGGMGEVLYGKYRQNCWEKEIMLAANRLDSVGRNPAVKHVHGGQ